ncbi:MAG: LuxR C-terminal-related transcriptional regulator [Candidatus Promineifilaceae bacterium]|nr:LuxR C-terminal-related transcriptional regulator [Candidatus Promineifilaceae bacterium]
MPQSLLRTKLFIPPLRPQRVSRPRLIRRLNQGLQQGVRLTLISAPAGFGKTALVTEWISASARPVAWLSPDERDSAPLRFLTYFIAALQTLRQSSGQDLRQVQASDFGSEILDLIHSPQPPPVESILIALLNEITTIRDDFIFVLDDYHLIDAQAIDEALTFLLEHLPPRMHLVITTREDPGLPLARLRVQSQLTELRVADLRFSPAEAAEFLNKVMDLNLSDEEIAGLEKRTEGWIAGLQMAALSLQGRTDTAAFIHAFTGSNRFVMDYLIDEVLQRQTADVRAFLLATSILGRLSGSLCTAVSGQPYSQKILQELERSNLLIIPLDDRRQWYRYHPLFADVLQAHLMEEQPNRVSTLHSKACQWFAGHDYLPEAISHAFAAGDMETAANLVERAWPAMERDFQNAAWLGWVKALPDEWARARPVLSLNYAWALLNSGQLEMAEFNLRNTERLLELIDDGGKPTDRDTAEIVIADQEQYRSLPASLATARAYLAQALGDVPATIKYAKRAYHLLAEKETLQRGIVAAILGLAYWTEGDLEIAYDTLAGGMADMQAAGRVQFAIRGTYILADIRLAQGRLLEAIQIYEELLELAAQQGEHVLHGTADLHLRLSELYLEQDNLQAAEQAMRHGQTLGEQASTPIWRYRYYLAQARAKKAQGDLDSALELLDEAQRHYVRTPVPDLQPIAALKARVWIAQGQLTAAQGWVREQELAVDDDLSYSREFEYITLVRWLIMHFRCNPQGNEIYESLALLERLLAAAEAGGRMGSVIEIGILQALSYQAQGSAAEALPPLRRALSLAEAQGYVHIFVDEGQPLAGLLSAVKAEGFMPAYVGKLLAAFAAAKQGQPAVSTHTAAPSPQPLVEPLSSRELEILHLVAEGLSNRQISERLFLAMSTVKGHNSRIYGKLDVRRRTEAVSRARELGLL